MRQEILKQLGEGYTQREVVKQISEKYHISIRGVYYNLERLDVWAKDYLELGDRKKELTNMLLKLYDMERKCSFDYIHTTDPNARIGFMRTRLEILKQIAQLKGLTHPDLTEPEEIRVRWLGSADSEEAPQPSPEPYSEDTYCSKSETT